VIRDQMGAPISALELIEPRSARPMIERAAPAECWNCRVLETRPGDRKVVPLSGPPGARMIQRQGREWTRVLVSLLIDATILFNLARPLSDHAMMKFTYLSI
jgi:hypothetical protein